MPRTSHRLMDSHSSSRLLDLALAFEISVLCAEPEKCLASTEYILTRPPAQEVFNPRARLTSNATSRLLSGSGHLVSAPQPYKSAMIRNAFSSEKECSKVWNVGQGMHLWSARLGYGDSRSPMGFIMEIIRLGWHDQLQVK